MSEAKIDADAAVLRAEAEKLAETLRYAAPETWAEHILDAMQGAYHLGMVSQ